MKELTMGGLFEGIGGFPLSATWAGIKPIWSNEIDPWCCKILRKNFDHEIIEKDIRLLTSDTQSRESGQQAEQERRQDIGGRSEERFFVTRPDIITGGFPCQPFSHAGKRKGKDDNRYLWPEYLRLIRELQPSWIIAENVAGLISMENGRTLEGILIDLEDENYQTEIYNIPACGVGAWHKRERIWIVCHSKSKRSQRGVRMEKSEEFKQRCENVSNSLKFNDDKSGYGTSSICGIGQTKAKIQGCEDAADTNHPGSQGRHRKELSERGIKRPTWLGDSQYNERIWEFESSVGRVANGIPGRVDRLKGLGNAIVPYVSYEFFKAIVEYENKLDQ